MIIKLAQPEEGGNFTGGETDKRTFLFVIDSASVLLNRQRLLPVGNWACVRPLLCQSLQPNLKSVTKTVTPFLLAWATHTSLKFLNLLVSVLSQNPPLQPLTTIPGEGVGSLGQKAMHHGNISERLQSCPWSQPVYPVVAAATESRARCYIIA